MLLKNKYSWWIYFLTIICWGIFFIKFLKREIAGLVENYKKFSWFIFSEEKEKIIDGEKLYNFISFCKTVLPKNSKVNWITGDSYSSMRIAYELTGHVILDSNPDYLLVYKPAENIHPKIYRAFPIDSKNLNKNATFLLSPGGKIGQTFVTGRLTKEISQIFLYFDRTVWYPNESLHLTLYENVDTKKILAKTNAQIGGQKLITPRISFVFDPPVSVNSAKQYYFELEPKITTSTKIMIDKEAHYTDGTAYVNGIPQSFDLWFQVLKAYTDYSIFTSSEYGLILKSTYSIQTK